MNIREKLLEELQQAMRDKNVIRRDTLRLLRSALSNAEIAAGRPLNEGEEKEVFIQEAKRRRDVMNEYSLLGRQDLVEKAKSELSVIEAYLPQQLTKDEIAKLVQDEIVQLGMKDTLSVGQIMKKIMPRIKGRADGRLVTTVVNEILSE